MSGEEGAGLFPSLKSEMDSFEMSELNQHVSAQVAMLACDLPRRALKEGSRLAAIALKPRVISKYEYNQNRVRDFKVCKDGEGAMEVGDVPDDEINAASFDPYPNAFTRAYCKNAFESGTLRLLHEKIWSFEFVRLIDVSELLIGDDGFMQLCDGLEKCPVHTLILTNNKITDKGLFRFADMWRSMAQLDTLKLANNKFTDKGVESMLHPTRYSPSVRVLDISKNRIGVRTAFYLGLMFVNERLAKLEDLSIGVRVGSLSHGDNFVLVLVAFLTSPMARPIRKLDLSDSGIGDVGVAAVASLAACALGLKELYISRNYISPRLRSLFFRALVVNKSINVFRFYYCGFNEYEEERIKRLGHSNVEGIGGPIPNVISTTNNTSSNNQKLSKAAAVALKYQQRLASSAKACKRPTLSWVESIELCDIIIRTLNTATIQMRKVLEGVSRNDVPPPLPSNKMFASDARGKLTVLQQISMYGRRSLKATPLRDELDALKYVTVRPVPVTFKKAMYLLGEIKKMTDLHSPGRGDDDDSSIMSKSAADSIEAGPQLYLKLVYGDIILLEKWLGYLQTVHMSRNVAISADASETKRLWERYNKSCAVVLDRLDAIRHLADEMVKTDSVVDILMEQANKQNYVTRPVVGADGEFLDQDDDDLSLYSTGVSSIGDNSVTTRALAPLSMKDDFIASNVGSPVSKAQTARTTHTANTEGTMTVQPEQTSARKALVGYDFLWCYRDEIFPYSENAEGDESRENCIEITAMAMEDYASSLFENLVASEEVIASNMRDSTIESLPDSEIAASLRIPYYSNIGLPAFYVHQCLVEMAKKNKNSDSSDIYSQADSTQASTCLDIQIKRKKKESRRTRRVVGRRFDIYSKSQKAARDAMEDEASDVIDGESLTMGSMTGGVEDHSLSTYGSIGGGVDDASQQTRDSRSTNF